MLSLESWRVLWKIWSSPYNKHIRPQNKDTFFFHFNFCVNYKDHDPNTVYVNSQLKHCPRTYYFIPKVAQLTGCYFSDNSLISVLGRENYSSRNTDRRTETSSTRFSILLHIVKYVQLVTCTCYFQFNSVNICFCAVRYIFLYFLMFIHPLSRINGLRGRQVFLFLPWIVIHIVSFGNYNWFCFGISCVRALPKL